jgi:hypothetical protein
LLLNELQLFFSAKIMRYIRSGFSFSVVLISIACCCLHQTLAIPLVFVVDDSQTQLTISGTLAGEPFLAQGSGSLNTRYTGSVNTELTKSTLQFTAGSAIDAETNGVWLPAAGGSSGCDPADYGMTNSIDLSIGAPMYFPGYAALRNIVLDLTSPVLTLTNAGFAGNSLIFSFVTNTAAFDYCYDNDSGSVALNGDSTNMVASGASLSTNAGLRTLAIQVSSQFQFSLIAENDSIINLTGQLVATNVVRLPPPVICAIVKNGQNAVITTENTTIQSSLLVSTDLTDCIPASTTSTTNEQGMIVFTSPISFPRTFYRVQQ